MQLRQSHRHFKANKLHPAAVEKAGMVCLCWGGLLNIAISYFLTVASFFGLWERVGGGGGLALGCPFILQPNISPSQSFSSQTCLWVSGCWDTPQHTSTRPPVSLPPLPVITVTPRGSVQRGFQGIIRRVISRLCMCVSV